MKDENKRIPLDDRVRLIRIQTFFRNASGNPLILMGVGVVSALVLRASGIAADHLLVWLALLIVVCMSTILFERHVKRIGLSQSNADQLFRVRTLLGYMACALYGGTVIFLFGLAPGAAHTFVFFITSSLVVVGYMAYPTAFPYCVAVNAITLLPFIVFCFYRYFSSADFFFLLLGCVLI